MREQKQAQFLGYHIVVLNNDHKHDRRGHRSINGQIGLKVPMQVIRAKCHPFFAKENQYIERNEPMIRCTVSLRNSNRSIGVWWSITHWQSTAINSIG